MRNTLSTNRIVASRSLAVLLVAIFFALCTGACSVDHTGAAPAKALFIGNSILTGNGGSGMCASSPDKDYYALVNAELSDRNPEYLAERISGKAWERCTTTAEQDELLESISSHLEDDLDLVVIQLGDNVKPGAGLPIFESGMNTFIDRVRDRCPYAKLVWVGAWYTSAEKQQTMEDTCAAQEVTWVNIALLNGSENQSEVGALVTYLDGTTGTVTDEGVASHPGDRGMALIADAIVSALD